MTTLFDGIIDGTSETSALSTSVSTKSPLRYPGGKSKAIKILVEALPESFRQSSDTSNSFRQSSGNNSQPSKASENFSQSRESSKIVVSPFMGGGSFELHLTGMGVRVEAYDGFRLLSNFWNALLERPHSLSERVSQSLGAATKETFKSSQNGLQKLSEEELFGSPEARLQSAAEFFIVNRCSFSGATLSGGFSSASASQRFTQSSVNTVENFWNPLLSVEHKMVDEVLAELVEDSRSVDLLFLDPPYLLEANKNKLYGIGGNLHTSFDHTAFRDGVVATGLPFLLTYNDCPQIRELWKAFDICEAEWNYGMNKSKKSSEIVIRNY